MALSTGLFRMKHRHPRQPASPPRSEATAPATPAADTPTSAAPEPVCAQTRAARPA